ncbi:elongator complex protein 5 [Tribolium madens]|uniref:elongator complex protein 5 n=1 Tax=Tribolium madens TaxID=41895 RepID=UPI001CF7518A|nr:elongator complex protein 5 [Tribolium madens]
MLSTYLNSLPYPKFVLIEDSVSAKGGEVLEHQLRNHAKSDYKTHLLVFESNFNKLRDRHSSCTCHDFTSDLRNWFGKSNDLRSVLNLSENCVVFVDSLSHVLYHYGVSETYKLFTELKNRKNVLQIVTILHTDLLENKDTIKYFRHLATLCIELDKKRLSYLYKKSQRKVINQLENYHFEDKKFVTETIKKPDTEIISETLNQPQNLTTFKISLTEKEKESRDGLVLPYLPKENDSSGGKIHYLLDEIDDWDEEDPDDDLDI